MSTLKASADKRWLVFLGLGLVLAAYTGVVASGLGRPGYSIDEEFTVFAARGIAEHGVPILPSGALENRGLPYTYVAWLSGALFGQGLPAYRLPSLICGVISVALIFRLASLVQPSGLALVTAATVALLPWQILSGQWARFYSMFLACSLYSLLLFWRTAKTGQGVRIWVASVAVAHLLHDFAITLVLLPGIAAVVVPTHRRWVLRPLRLTLLATAAFVVSEVALYGVHMATSAEAFTRTPYGYAVLHALPIAWETMTRTAADVPTMTYPLFAQFLELERAIAVVPVVVVGAAAGALLATRLGVTRVFGLIGGLLAALTQFARLWFVTALWAFSRPATALRTIVLGVLAVTVAALALAISLSWTQGAAFTVPFVGGILRFAYSETASVVWGLWHYYPLAATFLLVVGVVSAIRYQSAPLRLPRIVFLWVLWWLLVFDVLGVEFKPRYYVALWPLIILSTMYTPRLIPATWFKRARIVGPGRLIIAIGLAAALSWEHYLVADENRTERCLAGGLLCVPRMVTYDAPDVARLAGEVRPTDVVLCTDELLCEFLIGRVDYWLYTGTIFAYQSEGRAVGLYGGSPIIRDVTDLRTVFAGDRAHSRVWIILPSFRKYPSWTLEEILGAIPSTARARLQVVQSPTATVLRPAGGFD